MREAEDDSGFADVFNPSSARARVLSNLIFYLYLSIFDLLVEIIMKTILSLCKTSDDDIPVDSKLTNFRYADGVMF